MFKKSSIFAATILFFSFSTAYAAFSPAGLSILAPVQFPPTDFDIVGLRVSALFGNHRTVKGIDLAVIGSTTDIDSVGLRISGIFNYNKGTVTAVPGQIAGIVNINAQKTTVVGLQVAGLVNSNVAESTVVGLQVAIAANLCPFTSLYGVEIGIFNRAQSVHGLQIGVVNMTENLHGLQIGLLNFNRTGLFSVSPILNVGF